MSVYDEQDHLPRKPPDGDEPEILRVVDLVTHFPLTRGALFRREIARVRAVDGVSFVLYGRQMLALVGESGCGKSTVAASVLRLVRPTAGRVFIRGRDLTAASRRELRAIRGDMQVIFQDPLESLNPRLTVERIVAEPLTVRRRMPSRRQRQRRVAELLELVGLDADDARKYPHQFSGGQQQRIAIARALSTHPSLLLCDEPTSALDVSVQAVILNLLSDVKSGLGLACVLISHDLSVVRTVADAVAVMYLGKLVEFGETRTLYEWPAHPYTIGLLSAVPVPDPDAEDRRAPLKLRGDLPSPTAPPSGCRFHTRCWKAQEICAVVDPPLVEQQPGHWAACHFPEGEPDQ